MKTSYAIFLKMLTVAVVFAVAASSQTPSTGWYTGNSSAASFAISTADELAGLAALVNNGNSFEGKTVTLVSDIDLSVHYGESYNGGKGWVPIGLNGDDGSDRPFSGVFDGNGKTVNGLYINDPERDHVGLFGFCNGDIKDLGATNVSVLGRSSVGGIAGSFSTKRTDILSTITGCYVIGTVGGSGLGVGGVVGFNGRGLIGKCYFRGTVSAASSSSVGGIVGGSNSGVLTNCYSSGAVSGGEMVGGIAGAVDNRGHVANNYSTSAVSGSATSVGGIVGSGAALNCAALNPSVVGVYAQYAGPGRVGGYGGSANIAYNGMVNNDGLLAWNNIGANSRDGADIDGAVIRLDGTLGGRFTAEDGWVTANGFLPGFDAPVDMPDHLKYISAQIPDIITQPERRLMLGLGAVGATQDIAVEASVADGGTLSYRWYLSTTGGNASGVPVEGATSAVYPAPIDVEGAYNYYVIVTNTIGDNGDGGVKTMSVVSDVATLIVTATKAQVPYIATHPASGAVDVGVTHELIVKAYVLVKDGGTLSYQWYSNKTASNTGGTPIEGATDSVYAAPIGAEGVYCYYAVVTNTIEDNGDGGLKTREAVSAAAILSVGVTAINAPVPQVQYMSWDRTYQVGALVDVLVGEAGEYANTYSYQWYVNTTASTVGATPIDGATNGIYRFTPDAVGIFYYYVVITTAIEDNGDGGLKTASTTSYIVEINVLLHYVSVSSQDRIIPNAPPRTEATAIAPIIVPSSTFAVGPNPVARGGTVNFFYSGSRINSGVLVVYDASGNFVKKLKIVGKSVSVDNATRGIASWDLTNKKSRLVSTGTYLVKGVISPSNGKREKVSVMVSVR